VAFLKRLYTLQPQVAVNRGEFSALNQQDLRSLVSNNTALVEYVVTEDQVILFAITASGKELEVKAYELNATPSEITQKITGFRQSIDDHFAARDLYRLLLQPAENQIGERTKLIIVPDGQLWDVPFEALHLAEGKYVIDRASVSYAPSLSALKEIRRRRARAQSSTVLVFADPALTKETVERVQTTYNGLQMPATATKTNEIKKLQSIYGSTRIRSFIDARATKELLKSEMSTAGTLHLATPLILDNAVPMYSFLALSPNPDLYDDGLLRLSEITDLNSRARVVMLPNVFNSNSGNALVALSWSWFLAGTPAVVVNRRSESEPVNFVSELHQQLKTSPDPERFRQALLKFKKQRTSSQWAGCMFIGN
jgi:CHAT domain-containing protein